MPSIVLGSGEDVGDKVVLVKVPPTSKNIQHVKDRGLRVTRRGIPGRGPRGAALLPRGRRSRRRGSRVQGGDLRRGRTRRGRRHKRRRDGGDGGLGGGPATVSLSGFLPYRVLESGEDGSRARRGRGGSRSDVLIARARILGSQVGIEFFYGFRHSG